MKFIQKLILLIQGKLPDYNEYLVRVMNLESAVRTLRQEKMALEDKLVRKEVKIPIEAFESMDTEPVDRPERFLYVSQVDDFYESVLKRKIQVSISEVRGLLAGLPMENGLPKNISRSEYDYFLRGMEAFAWKIHDWATVLQAERKELEADINN